jgi:hypothetical protein
MPLAQEEGRAQPRGHRRQGVVQAEQLVGIGLRRRRLLRAVEVAQNFAVRPAGRCQLLREADVVRDLEQPG